jgi:hypothetical protein
MFYSDTGINFIKPFSTLSIFRRNKLECNIALHFHKGHKPSQVTNGRLWASLANIRQGQKGLLSPNALDYLSEAPATKKIF